MMKIIIISIISLILLLGACTTPEPPACIKGKNKHVIIRWGTHNFKDEKIDGFQLDMTGKLSTYKWRKTIQGDTAKIVTEDLEEIKYVDSVEFCQIMGFIKEVLQKTQVVHIPADTCRFVEYHNPEVSVRIRGVWHDNVLMKKNQNNSNFGPLGFKMIYDALDHLTLSDEEKEKLEAEEQLKK
jgi:hypothetical protein